MTIQGLKITSAFPALITPKEELNQNTWQDLIKTNRDELYPLLLKHGGLLFRNFPIKNADDFENLITLLQLGKFVNYVGGDSPRDKVKHKIYTSTEAPPNLHIPLHQELSFMRQFPKHIYFYCDIAPSQGGETIIADARKIYTSLALETKYLFEEKQLTYISRYWNESWLMRSLNRIVRSHKSWREVFETDLKTEVERKCQENNFQCEWLPKDWVKVTQTCAASIAHPKTAEKVWFNQAHLYDFNPKLLGVKRYLGAKLFYLKSSTRLHEIYFADGSRIPRKHLYHILDILNQETVKFPWQKNDVLVLDNILSMHGRAPFKGPRRILTALTI